MLPRKVNAESASQLRTLQTEAKIAYIRLNIPTACPPRTAVPVYQGRGLASLFISARPARFRSGMRLIQLFEFMIGRNRSSCQRSTEFTLIFKFLSREARARSREHMQTWMPYSHFGVLGISTEPPKERRFVVKLWRILIGQPFSPVASRHHHRVPILGRLRTSSLRLLVAIQTRNLPARLLPTVIRCRLEALVTALFTRQVTSLFAHSRRLIRWGRFPCPLPKAAKLMAIRRLARSMAECVPIFYAHRKHNIRCLRHLDETA
jgi:hypothetical protein